MPNCFQLTPKGSTEPATLPNVDLALRKHFNVDDDGTWYKGWYATIGLGLACGNSWVKLKEIFPDKADVIDYLAEHYTTDAWYETKR